MEIMRRASFDRVVRHRVVRGRKPRWLLTGAVVSLFGYLALAALAAQQQIFALDYGTRTWVAILRHEVLNLPMQIVTILGDNLGLVPLIAIAFVVLWRVSRRWAIALPALMLGTGGLQWLAKWSANRPRPDATPWGFPSGHVLSLVVFFGLMIYLVATASRRRRRWRVLASLVCLVAVAAVAFSRLYLDRHWLSDVGGGFSIGLAYLLLAIWLVEVVLVRAASVQADATSVEADATGEPVLASTPRDADRV
jgi:membrane-associated phospholipid phosphatase